MTLTFVVRNQTLLYIDTKVIPRIGSAKYLELKFKFITKDWTNLRKTLHISAGEYSEPFVLQSDTFQVPTYYTQQSAFTVTLLGDSDDGVVVPTNEVTMSLDESNTLWTAVPPDPQNSAYLELLKSIVPSDWNQNDPTAKDYIKNRPFYSTVGEGVIATGARGIMSASQFGKEPIPKVRINDVIYTNVASTGLEGMYYVFEFSPYTVKVNPMYFYIIILEGSAPATISADDIEILGETTIYTPIPEQYLPSSVATKADVVQSDWSQNNEKAKDFIKNKPSVITRHNVNFVIPLSVSGGIANINTPSFTYSDVVVVASSSLTEKISFKKVATSVVTAEIYSCKTGKPITDAELPYGYIVITRFQLLPDNTTRIVYCLNPV